MTRRAMFNIIQIYNKTIAQISRETTTKHIMQRKKEIKEHHTKHQSAPNLYLTT
ncbi:hypothetical protein HanPSC8_Chr02g0066231 [Helianthus annuus]|nr:hypothetical protein HanPSC8_Chr02g0066231 [Helianthus annuus]